MTAQKIVVVTGANRGIGLAICQKILTQHSPVKLYACSRAGKDLNLRASNSSNSTISYPKLDITNLSQIQSLASTIKSTDGHVDVLINNAGLNSSDSADPSVAAEIMKINYHGTADMCLTLAPLVSTSGSGRVVNVSSTACQLGGYSKELQGRFRDPNVSVEEINTLADAYLEAQRKGEVQEWGDREAYSVSKACVNALTVALARDHRDLLVNCCCPGWVDTDMGGIVGNPPKSTEEGAKIPVKLGFGDIGGVSGKYWGNPGVYDTGDGEVRPW